MKISVCMICKNEQEVIVRCLECVKKFADEIIIVDTNSSDRTKEICKRYTDKVFDFKWNYDFSAARNYSISFASNDYVMWLDADDVIYEEDIEKINELKNEKNPYDTYMFKYVLTEDEYGNDGFYFYRERIMKRCAALRFYGFIHETVAPFGKITYKDIKIRHKKIGKGDPARNLFIYEMHLKNGAVLDARNVYYYAKELFYNGKYDRCKNELLRYLAMPNKYAPDETDALKTLSKCEKNDSKALDYLFDALKRFKADAETLCLIASRFESSGKVKEAIDYYKFALCVEKNDLKGFVDQSYYYFIPLLSLTSLCYKIGEKDKAKQFHMIAKKIYPDNERVLFNDKFFS